MPLEISQVHMLRRVARCLCNLDPNEGDGQGQVRPRPQVESELPAKKVGRTIKLAHTVDQGDDTEVAAMTIADARKLHLAFRKQNDGLPPTGDEEATPEQMQGIRTKLTADVVPFADFGILRPHGGRLGRALKFQAKIWNPESGEFTARELPGPGTFEDWR
eukprot:664239-Amphidinium_carterae.1